MKRIREQFGVLYFVDGNPAFREMLRISIESLRRFHPEWPIEVIERPSFPVPLWKQVYRGVSFWKWHRRRDRAHQDARVIAAKAEAMLNTPFETTLYLDVDTIVMRPLDAYRRRALQADVLATPLDWKRYQGLADWQPASFPVVMAGLSFYNRRFVDAYRPYVRRLAPIADRLPSMDQYIFSLACEMESSRLEIMKDRDFQFDVINAAQHAGTPDYPRIDRCVDLKWPGLERFHVFHYNEHKPQYLRQIKQVWGLPSTP